MLSICYIAFLLLLSRVVLDPPVFHVMDMAAHRQTAIHKDVLEIDVAVTVGVQVGVMGEEEVVAAEVEGEEEVGGGRRQLVVDGVEDHLSQNKTYL